MPNPGSGAKRRKIMAIIVFDVFLIVCLIIYFGILRPHNEIKINGTYIKTPESIGEFHLTDNRGMPFSNKNLEGRWSMIFFGFTHCQMICPTTMVELNKMYRQLQQALPKSQLPLVVFISVDPKNDTVENLNKFVNSFNPDFIALRGNIEEIVQLERQLHLPISKDPVNHSTEILLLNPEAKVQAYFTYPHQAEQLVKSYQNILNQSKEVQKKPTEVISSNSLKTHP